MKTLAVVAAAALLLAGVTAASAQEARPPKDPTVAFGYSFLFPGFGQFYNEDNGRGLLMFATGVTGVVLLAAGDGDARAAGAIVYGVDWLISVVEAPVRASQLNRMSRSENQGLLHFAGGKMQWGIPSPHGRSAGPNAKEVILDVVTASW